MKKPLKLILTGMHCDSCIRRVTAALQCIPGIQIDSVKVGSAQLAFNPEQSTPSDILAAVNNIGFPASIQE